MEWDTSGSHAGGIYFVVGILTLIAATLLKSGPSKRQQVVPIVDSQIRRYPPDSFPELPSSVRADLTRRGCRIPQALSPPARVNVARGRFFSRSELDWVVLCSRGGASVILVYRPGHHAVAIGQPVGDANFMQSDDEAGVQMIFSRVVSAAKPAEIKRYSASDDEKLPFAITHDGISDAFVDKASTILYWNGKHWVDLPGAD